MEYYKSFIRMNFKNMYCNYYNQVLKNKRGQKRQMTKSITRIKEEDFDKFQEDLGYMITEFDYANGTLSEYNSMIKGRHPISVKHAFEGSTYIYKYSNEAADREVDKIIPIPENARTLVLSGTRGSGKTSLFKQMIGSRELSFPSSSPYSNRKECSFEALIEEYYDKFEAVFTLESYDCILTKFTNRYAKCLMDYTLSKGSFEYEDSLSAFFKDLDIEHTIDNETLDMFINDCKHISSKFDYWVEGQGKFMQGNEDYNFRCGIRDISLEVAVSSKYVSNVIEIIKCGIFNTIRGIVDKDSKVCINIICQGKSLSLDEYKYTDYPVVIYISSNDPSTRWMYMLLDDFRLAITPCARIMRLHIQDTMGMGNVFVVDCDDIDTNTGVVCISDRLLGYLMNCYKIIVTRSSVERVSIDYVLLLRIFINLGMLSKIELVETKLDISGVTIPNHLERHTENVISELLFLARDYERYEYTKVLSSDESTISNFLYSVSSCVEHLNIKVEGDGICYPNRYIPNHKYLNSKYTNPCMLIQSLHRSNDSYGVNGLEKMNLSSIKLIRYIDKFTVKCNSNFKDILNKMDNLDLLLFTNEFDNVKTGQCESRLVGMVTYELFNIVTSIFMELTSNAILSSRITFMISEELNKFAREYCSKLLSGYNIEYTFNQSLDKNKDINDEYLFNSLTKIFSSLNIRRV